MSSRDKRSVGACTLRSRWRAHSPSRTVPCASTWSPGPSIRPGVPPETLSSCTVGMATSRFQWHKTSGELLQLRYCSNTLHHRVTHVSALHVPLSSLARLVDYLRSARLPLVCDMPLERCTLAASSWCLHSRSSTRTQNLYKHVSRWAAFESVSMLNGAFVVYDS